MDPTLDISCLDGKILAIICRDYPNLTFYCTFEDQQMLIMSSAPDTVDTIITATLQDFLLFALKQKANLQISGDMHLAQDCQKILASLNIDWEEELSKYTGDVIAYTTMQTLRKLRVRSVATKDSLSEMITEYLQEESGVLPTNYEVNNFMQEVDQLKLMVDRLEAKVNLYENS